ncbi:Zinc finger and BTB domain-containing protein 38 [Folsomia candida]|uniref:Zinc finger and BTB domain-containing protein 38 n=1 Tax=Folsomia candida TaxID=158441 RepID=A0A226D746_FOLCA|nr:Zinc finger and BTB domain-containing protein 38 [Folsomia candida]
MWGAEVFPRSTKNRTGHILQDLLSSTVRLTRLNSIPPKERPLKIKENNSSPELIQSFCSICSEWTNLSPLAVQEIEILAKFVLNQEQISLILQSDDHPPSILCCKICSSAILSLAKLSTRIENITISLRAVISSRNGLFNNESKIGELSYETAADTGCPVDKNSNNDHDDDEQQLTGYIDEEEFLVKVEPTSDDDEDDDDRYKSLSDPLYDPDRPQTPDDDTSDLAKSEVKPPPKFVCHVCRLKFSKNQSLFFHMRNIHPDDVQARFRPKKYACKLCNMKFALIPNIRRHLRNKKKHPNLSDADISVLESEIDTEPKFVCEVCQPNVAFAENEDFVRHLRDKKIHPEFPGPQIASDFYNKMCSVDQKAINFPHCRPNILLRLVLHIYLSNNELLFLRLVLYKMSDDDLSPTPGDEYYRPVLRSISCKVPANYRLFVASMIDLSHLDKVSDVKVAY